ncbi:MAG: hypothetical protein KBG14_00715 [Bacteroidales bacterium]|nr:hypothetical protein [Bacteroidales bacterium]
MKKIITTSILILLTALIYAQDSDINRNCEYARFEISFPDSLDNNCIDTALQIRICKYLIEKIKYPDELYADCIKGDFILYFKFKANGFIDTTQLRMIESIDKRIDNQVIDLFKKMPGLYLERQLHSMRYEQIPPIKIEEKEFCLRFKCIVTETKSKKNVEAKIMKVDKK